jgi:hypothetical protein
MNTPSIPIVYGNVFYLTVKVVFCESVCDLKLGD